jgi:cyclopropane-fatty-acyl-phospholipid synthase
LIFLLFLFALQMETKPVFVTYWLNRLQNLDAPENIFVSLNPYHRPAADKIHTQMVYDHPQFTADSIRAQGDVARIQGRDGLWFCGAWMGYGFHEDGVRSGLEVAVAISGEPVPWVSRLGPDQMIPARAGMATTPSPLTLSYYLQPIRRHAEALCRDAVFHFLRGGVKTGCITFKLPGGKVVSIGETHLQNSADEVVIQVFSMNFFVRIALESSLGLGRSYIAGEWEVEGTGRYSDGLTRFLTVLLKNKLNSSER